MTALDCIIVIKATPRLENTPLFPQTSQSTSISIILQTFMRHFVFQL